MSLPVGEGVRRVGPQVNKFEQISRSDVGGGGYPTM